MTNLHIHRQERGSAFDESLFTIIGETRDGMPVASKVNEWYFLTDGVKILTDGFHRIDSLGQYTYVAWHNSYATNITLDAESIDFDSIEEIRQNHELQ